MVEKEEITASGYIETAGGTFEIDGQAVASPSGIKYEEHTLSRSWNDAYGVQQKYNYRLRRKVIWIYNIIGRESLKKIYNILNNKRLKGSTRFNIKTEYFTGVEEMNVEWGTPFNPQTVDSRPNLFSVEISFVEPEGTFIYTGELSE